MDCTVPRCSTAVQSSRGAARARHEPAAAAGGGHPGAGVRSRGARPAGVGRHLVGEQGQLQAGCHLSRQLPQAAAGRRRRRQRAPVQAAQDVEHERPRQLQVDRKRGGCAAQRNTQGLQAQETPLAGWRACSGATEQPPTARLREQAGPQAVRRRDGGRRRLAELPWQGAQAFRQAAGRAPGRQLSWTPAQQAQEPRHAGRVHRQPCTAASAARCMLGWLVGCAGHNQAPT